METKLRRHAARAPTQHQLRFSLSSAPNRWIQTPKHRLQAQHSCSPPSRAFALAGVPFGCSSLPRKNLPKTGTPAKANTQLNPQNLPSPLISPQPLPHIS